MIGLVLTLILAIWIIIDLLTGQQNKLAAFFMRISILAFFLGLILPKVGIYFAIFTTGYIDYFKRLMIVDINLRYDDLFAVLGMTPLLVLGMFLHYFISWFAGKYALKQGQKRIFFVSITLMAFNGFSLIGFGSWQGGLITGLANSVTYCALIWIIPMMFSTPEEVEKLLVRTCAIFIPCVFYMFFQVKYGLQGFEVDYLNTGFSLEQRIFGDAELRLFSTMNSAANYSTVVSILAVCWIAPRMNTTYQLVGIRANLLGIAAFILFIFSSYFTLSRGGWACALAMIAGLIFFRRKVSAIFLTVSMSLMVLVMALSTEWINKSGIIVEATEDMTSNNAKANMATRLGTFSGRLDSMYLTLTVPERWTPFGISFSGVNVKTMAQDQIRTSRVARGTDILGFRGKYYSHDGFSDLLLRIGYIPLALLSAAGIYVLRRVLFYIEYARYQSSRRVFTLCFAAVIGVLTGYIANAEQIRTFPVNFYLYFFAGCLGAVYSFYRYQIKNVDDSLPSQLK